MGAVEVGEEAFEEFVIFDGLLFVVAPYPGTSNHVALNHLFFWGSLSLANCFAVLVHASFGQFRLEVIAFRRLGDLLLLLFF